MKEEYYRPGEIKYSPTQIRWLLRNVLFQSEWPRDYTGGKGKTLGHHAKFEMIRMIIGELNARLQLCGKAGLYFEYLTLIDDGDKDYRLQRLAGYHGTTAREVDYLSNMAIRYCCGFRRKRVTFKEFCAYTKTRDEKRKANYKSKLEEM